MVASLFMDENTSQAAIINIEWSGPFPYEKAAEFISDDIDFGIYQIYGTSPDAGNSRLLYIGRAQGGSFGWRIPQHLGWLDGNSIGQRYIRLGRLAGATTPTNDIWDIQIELAELLLIFSHKPPFNERVNLGNSESSVQNLHICNWGEKGDIFPEVSGLRWTTAGSEAIRNIFSVKSRETHMPPTSLP